MVMTSQQVAALTAQHQQFHLNQAQIASQYVGPGTTYGPQAAQNVGGGLLNAGAKVAAPAFGVGSMLLGVDPFSMGLKGAMAGGARAGIAGAIGGGALAASAVAAPAMAATWAGGQVMQGARSQHAFNAQMAGTYQHFNNAGGRGFTIGELGSLGSMTRSMSQERGPGGEFSTMQELTSLATNMGRMGMLGGQGVQDVQQFRTKFREMVASVKEVATALSTSLEEAQQMMSGMRGSGIFGTSSQVRMAGQLRSAAAGGNVTVAELTQAANIGSNISRAIGGLGGQGARAGVTALSRIGGAQSAGVLSEEDIYNTTGLTGAQGRQAMAAQQLQGDARFFRGRIGRHVLASVAGEDGNIDMEAVRDIMDGNVSAGETRRKQRTHAYRAGAANFIRHEGRLRGQALQAFGGMGRIAGLAGLLRGKGYDIENMDDDRAQILLQRVGKMGTEEANAAVKQFRGRHKIFDKMEERQMEDELSRDFELTQRRTGVEGYKRKFEGFRKDITDSLKQTGADLATETDLFVEGVLNRLTGKRAMRVKKDLAATVRGVLRGDATASAAFQDLTTAAEGQGGNRFAQQDFGAQLALYKDVNQDALAQAGIDTRKYGGDSLLDGLFGGGTDAGKSMRALKERVFEAQKVHASSFTKNVAALSVGSNNKEALAQMFGAIGGARGRDVMQRALEYTKDVKELAPLHQQLKGARSDKERAAILGSSARGAGLGDAASKILEVPDLVDTTLFGDGVDVTEGAFQERLGGALTEGLTRRVVRGRAGHGTTEQAQQFTGGAERRAVAQRMLSAEGLETARGLTSGDEERRQKAMQGLAKGIQEIRGRRKTGFMATLFGDEGLSNIDQAQLATMRQQQAVGAAEALKQQYLEQDPDLDPEEAEQRAYEEAAKRANAGGDEVKVSAEGLRKTAGTLQDYAQAEKIRKQRQMAGRIRQGARKDILSLRKGGFLDAGNAQVEGLKDTAGASEFFREFVQSREAMGSGDIGTQRGGNEQLQAAMEGLREGTFAEREERLDALGGIDSEAVRGVVRGERRRLKGTKRISRTLRSERASVGTVAQMLGVGSARSLAGRSAEDMRENLQERLLGLGADEGKVKSLVKTMGMKASEFGGKEGKASEIQAKMDALRDTVEKGKKEEQDAASAANDPSYRELQKISGASEDTANSMKRLLVEVHDLKPEKNKEGEGDK